MEILPLNYYTQDGKQFILKSITAFKILRIIFLLVLAAVTVTITGGSFRTISMAVTFSLFCISFAIIYLLQLSARLIIDKNTEQITIKENIFSRTQQFSIKDFAKIHISQSTTNFVPICATSYLIFYNKGIQSTAILEQKYFSTISSLQKLITETEMIINSKS